MRSANVAAVPFRDIISSYAENPSARIVAFKEKEK